MMCLRESVMWHMWHVNVHVGCKAADKFFHSRCWKEGLQGCHLQPAVTLQVFATNFKMCFLYLSVKLSNDLCHEPEKQVSLCGAPHVATGYSLKCAWNCLNLVEAIPDRLTVALILSLEFRLKMTQNMRSAHGLCTERVYCFRQVENMWKTCGKHVENMWKTCGKHVETVQMALQSERLETPWTALESLNRLHYWNEVPCGDNQDCPRFNEFLQ